MKHTILINMGLGLCAFSSIALGIEPASLDAEQAPVEYVKICSLYGPGYYYIPGTDVCFNASTGTTKELTELGLITGQSELEARIEALEFQLKELEQKLGITQ